MNKLSLRVIVLLVITAATSSCKKVLNDFDADSFEAALNFNEGFNDEKLLFMDYNGTIENGFVIPSIRQSSDGKFHCSFSLKNISSIDQKFYYKLYYQNSSYKWPEKKKDMFVFEENKLASENFYGSWEDNSIGFMSTDTINADSIYYSVETSFRILGNPRDEIAFFGVSPRPKQPTNFEIEHFVNAIKQNKDWTDAILLKAQQNNVAFDDQILADALYMASKEDEQINNQRWKRNPRVGNYEFMLVVCTEDVLRDSLIPNYISDISKTDGESYRNPFYYFKHGPGARIQNVVVLDAVDNITLKASPDLGKGIFIGQPDFRIDTEEHFNSNCGKSDQLFSNATIEQFFHYDTGRKMQNVKNLFDVNSDDFTRAMYDSLTKVPDSEREEIGITSSRCPCETVSSDSVENSISIRNPGGKLKKENVGVVTRHGFTFGKFRAKVKLTELINKHDVWNGLTNAIWMINQSHEEWNMRRECEDYGYIPKKYYAADAPRIPKSAYTEIDFEIVKASKMWPRSSYKAERDAPDIINTKDHIAIACTNWDLACPQPKNFDAGAEKFKHKYGENILHRWTHWYQALTSKVVASDDELFGGDHYYFEIDWQPGSITWSVGPEPDQMRVVCHMDDTYTSIPNNQMLMVFTQEYHFSDWWPTTPYRQENIPAPLNAIEGKILEIVIE